MDEETETVEYIPGSWVDEAGVRHAVVFEDGLDEYMRLVNIDGKWVLNDRAPF